MQSLFSERFTNLIDWLSRPISDKRKLPDENELIERILCGAQTMYIEPGSPWENGYIGSFNSRMQDEFPDGEIFCTLKQAEILLERYNTVLPHSSLKYRPPAPEATLVTAC
jgi:transposase InsO family protein